MPYLNIQTNVAIDAATQTQLLEKMSNSVATALGKPEQYVMVALQPETPMVFSGNDSPAAFLQLKSLGLQESQTSALSAHLCQCIEQSLSLPAERVYIEFSASPRKMWGWNGGTF